MTTSDLPSPHQDGDHRLSREQDIARLLGKLRRGRSNAA